MPWNTNWKCDGKEGKVYCSIKFNVKSWALTPDASKNASIVSNLASKTRKIIEENLNGKIPSGTISVDEKERIITITGMNPGDVERIKKDVDGKQGIKQVKESRGKREQVAVGLDQVMTCHQATSKDGKPLDVTSATNGSPYDHLPHLRPTMVVVHTEKLMEEWTSKMESFLGIPRSEIGKIGGGRNDHCFVTLSTIQSLSKDDVNDAVKGKINLLISDEVHHSSAGEWKKAACGLNVLEEGEFVMKNPETGKEEKVVLPVKYLPPEQRVKTLGLSATPTPFGEERTKILEECIGPTLVNIKDSDIINQGYILPVKMKRESLEPERQTKFVTDVARMLSSDFTSMLNEKKSSAMMDFNREYNQDTYEDAFGSAVGGAQFAAASYDENKIKRAISRITETPGENFLVYSPRVIPLYAVSTILRDLHVDDHVVPFIGKGSQEISKYKGVKRQIDEIIEEIEKSEKEISEKEKERKVKGNLSPKEENALSQLKLQSKYLEEIAKTGIGQSLEKLREVNDTWIKTGSYPSALLDEIRWIPSEFSKSNPVPLVRSWLKRIKNQNTMTMDEFMDVKFTSRMRQEDVKPPIIMPTMLWVGGEWKERVLAWVPRREYKPKQFQKWVVNQAPDPWEGNEKFNYGTSSSMARWQEMKLFNDYITEVKNLKVAGSVIKHDMSKDDFDDQNIRENFATGKSRVLPLSTAGQEGVDIPNANNLIVMSIFTKPKDPIQLTGRIKRIADGKKPGDALFLNVKGTSDDAYFRNLMKGLMIDVFETEHGEEFREELKGELDAKKSTS